MRDALDHEVTTGAAARAGRVDEARQLVCEVRAARPAGGVPTLYRRIERPL